MSQKGNVQMESKTGTKASKTRQRMEYLVCHGILLMHFSCKTIAGTQTKTRRRGAGATMLRDGTIVI